MKNPFELTFGLKPTNYISRLKQSEEIISNFNSSTGNKVYFITGISGTGKTVMLSHISEQLLNENNWIVIELIPNYDMLKQLASELYNSCIFNKIFSEQTFGYSFTSIPYPYANEIPIKNVLSLIEVLLGKIKNARKEVLITVDDVSNSGFVKTFTQVFQLLLRKEYPIRLLMTGLYETIFDLQNDKDLTFLYRAPKISLEPLNLAAIAQSYQELLNIDKASALALAKETKGYAYAYQVLGYIIFESKSRELNDNLYSKFDQYLDEYVYDKMYRKLSTHDKLILKAFNSDSINSVENLLISLKMKKNVFSVYRDRLLKRGIIEAPEYGQLSLKLPRFYEFLERQLY